MNEPHFNHLDGIFAAYDLAQEFGDDNLDEVRAAWLAVPVADRAAYNTETVARRMFGSHDTLEQLREDEYRNDRAAGMFSDEWGGGTGMRPKF